MCSLYSLNCLDWLLKDAASQDGTPNGDGVHRVEKAVLPGALSEEAIQLERLQKELRTVAALEVCTATCLQTHRASVSLACSYPDCDAQQFPCSP